MKHIKKFNEEIKIIKKEKLSYQEKLDKLDEIINKYGIATNTGTIRTYEDYLKFKEKNPGFKYPKLDDEISAKKREIGFLFIKKNEGIEDDIKQFKKEKKEKMDKIKNLSDYAPYGTKECQNRCNREVINTKTGRVIVCHNCKRIVKDDRK